MLLQYALLLRSPTYSIYLSLRFMVQEGIWVWAPELASLRVWILVLDQGIIEYA